MDSQLFHGKLVRLAALNPDTDAAIESRWSHDPEFLRLLGDAPIRPLSTAQIKRKYEKAYKEKDQFHFGLRTHDDDRLVGVVRLSEIEWNNGTTGLKLGVGDPADRGRGHGSDGLSLLLRYAFDELNLHRVTAWTSEYNSGAIRFFERAGFVIEVRRREAFHCDGRRWDRLLLGLLREDWEKKKSVSHRGQT